MAKSRCREAALYPEDLFGWAGTLSGGRVDNDLGEEHWRLAMAEKFNLAPCDKLTADPREAERRDQELHAKLEAGLIYM